MMADAPELSVQAAVEWTTEDFLAASIPRHSMRDVLVLTQLCVGYLNPGLCIIQIHIAVARKW
jgi:hypothetical protein